jgi:mRNA-degrading endonuclease toxin of MazEF toxin-antitoxin module
MQDAFGRAGSISRVFSGDLWNIPDKLITFADFNLFRRTEYESRYILVLQGDEHGDNALCETVLVCPLSSNLEHKQSWEALLPTVESGLRKDSLVKLQLMQPISRRRLLQEGTHSGSIEEDVLQRMRRHLLQNLGIVAR